MRHTIAKFPVINVLCTQAVHIFHSLHQFTSAMRKFVHPVLLFLVSYFPSCRLYRFWTMSGRVPAAFAFSIVSNQVPGASPQRQKQAARRSSWYRRHKHRRHEHGGCLWRFSVASMMLWHTKYGQTIAILLRDIPEKVSC
jgi:hypothetical protein